MTRRHWPLVILFTALALCVRLWFVLVQHRLQDFIYSDMKGSFDAARVFANPRHVWELWDTVKSRAMPYTGAVMLRTFGKNGLTAWGVLQALLSAFTIPFAFIGLRRFFGAQAALVACAFFAIDWLSIVFTGFLMSETYLIFFLALSWALLAPKKPFLCLLSGIALGLGCLYKAQPTTLVPPLCLALWFFDGQKPWQLSFQKQSRQKWSAVLLGAGVLLAVVPECIAVSRIVGRPTFLSTYGGQNVYVGHCEAKMLTCDGGPQGYFNSGVPKYYQREEAWPDVQIKVAVFDSAYYARVGWECFTQSFGFAFRWSVQQIFDVFAGWPGSTIDPWPSSSTRDFLPSRIANLAIAYFFVPLAFWTLWRRRRRLSAWLGFGVPMLSVFIIAELFSGDPRYRMPFDFFIIGAGSLSLVRAFAYVKLLKRSALRVAGAE